MKTARTRKKPRVRTKKGPSDSFPRIGSVSHGDQNFPSRSGGGGLWFGFAGLCRFSHETLSSLANLGGQSFGSFSHRVARQGLRKFDQRRDLSGFLDSRYLRRLYDFFDFRTGRHGFYQDGTMDARIHLSELEPLWHPVGHLPRFSPLFLF